jgi:hypothetical protein
MLTRHYYSNAAYPADLVALFLSHDKSAHPLVELSFSTGQEGRNYSSFLISNPNYATLDIHEYVRSYNQVLVTQGGLASRLEQICEEQPDIKYMVLHTRPGCFVVDLDIGEFKEFYTKYRQDYSMTEKLDRHCFHQLLHAAWQVFQCIIDRLQIGTSFQVDQSKPQKAMLCFSGSGGCHLFFNYADWPHLSFMTAKQRSKFAKKIKKFASDIFVPESINQVLHGSAFDPATQSWSSHSVQSNARVPMDEEVGPQTHNIRVPFSPNLKGSFSSTPIGIFKSNGQVTMSNVYDPERFVTDSCSIKWCNVDDEADNICKSKAASDVLKMFLE